MVESLRQIFLERIAKLDSGLKGDYTWRAFAEQSSKNNCD